MIPIYKPYLPPWILQYAHDAIDSRWVSSIGEYKHLAEESLQDLLGVKKVLLTSNGTVANHLMVKALKYKFPSIKRIIVPDSVYVAVWNCLMYDKLDWQIDVIDTDADTWNFNESLISVDENSAIMAVSNLGNIVDVPKLKKLGVPIIEDNCEGIFGKYGDRYSGTESLCSTLSFFGNKNITSGEGGALITDDEEIYNYVNKIHGQGQSSQRYVHDVLGYNYRMTNIQASILYGQLKYRSEIIERKENIFNFYKENLSGVYGIKLQKETPNTKHSNWMFGIYLDIMDSYSEKELAYKKEGIEIRPFFYPVMAHDHLRSIWKINPTATLLSNKCIMLPSYPDLTKEELTHICNVTKRIAYG